MVFAQVILILYIVINVYFVAMVQTDVGTTLDMKASRASMK
ncbi:hypothetical protein EMGBS15_07370 [Filimonas sp.]|nr:hypothetical protein EMGBS15_07370 [Filimonas sp.]